MAYIFNIKCNKCGNEQIVSEGFTICDCYRLNKIKKGVISGVLKQRNLRQILERYPDTTLSWNAFYVCPVCMTLEYDTRIYAIRLSEKENYFSERIFCYPYGRPKCKLCGGKMKTMLISDIIEDKSYNCSRCNGNLIISFMGWSD